MSRLIIVSNRVPALGDGGAAAGGLAVALHAALEQHGGMWFGWSGENSGDKESDRLQTTEVGNITYALVDLTKRDLEEYYAGFANRALWPLFHYRLDLTDFSRRDMAGYFRVNRYFARLLAPLIRPDDIIWVHDYHLIPLASELRQMGLRNRMGFFLHIPWPPPDVLFALPPHETIVRSLSSYDLVGFQTEFDAENFAACLIREGFGSRVGTQVFDAYGRLFGMGVFPIGIETQTFAELAAASTSDVLVERMRHSLDGMQLLIGVDRLDYSKGLGERIQGFSRYIETNPASRGKVVYLQVTPKSRSEVPEYADMQKEIAELAGRVNGSLGDVDWTPIRYINRTVKRQALAGLYRMARAGLVTPLRDGMNLVAKEFIASQDPEDPGVLVLSRFAGAARELDGALLVNPYDTEDIATAIARAMNMPVAERIERWTPMFERIDKHDVMAWCHSFLEALKRTRVMARAS
ncbi:MAG: alpha,alpha-trehalose-phosphate synthase (UDP-forming) [Bauldia sp.]|nr:alpha,alpha-trehalose-phosphate synthase (UDP-forming) [Bauldia sp.]